MLASLPGARLTPMDVGCCGMAGAFGYEQKHFDLSVQIARLELEPALLSQPEAIIIANGTSCRHQIRDLTMRQAMHPIEFIHSYLNRDVCPNSTLLERN